MRVIEFRENPEPLLLMPYYPLGSLADCHNATQEQHASAFRQVLLGIRHLHQRGVVHRDIKLENLLIEAPFTVIISDFGLSKVTSDNVLTTFCGTKEFCAPEVFPGNGGYRFPADIWSIGVVFLELLYGLPDEPNLYGVSWDTGWTKAIVGKVNFEDDDLMTDILARMLKIEPLERFTAAECLERGCNTGLFAKAPDGQIFDGAKPSNGTTTRSNPFLQTKPLRTNILQTKPLRTDRTNPMQNNNLPKGNADARSTRMRACRNRRYVPGNTDRLFNNAENTGAFQDNHLLAMDVIEPWSIIKKPKVHRTHLRGIYIRQNEPFWKYMR